MDRENGITEMIKDTLLKRTLGMDYGFKPNPTEKETKVLKMKGYRIKVIENGEM